MIAPPPPSTTDGPAGEITGYSLMIISELGVSRRSIPAQGAITIGRDETAVVRLDNSRVSRQHAVLHVYGGSFAIEDRGSANGTVVHNRRLPAGERVAIAPGDAVHVGDFVLLVRALSGDEEMDGDVAPPVPALPGDVVVRSRAGLAAFAEAAQVARSDINVLLLGETGAGKDVLARCLHHLSDRRDRPFLRLNCAALSESLLESELFGHEKGAFTGATAAKQGLFESAAGGTVFLDEIGEFPASLQPKLLQVLEAREVLRVGSVRPISVDVRFVAASNRDLEAEIAGKRFRADLYYRLSGFSIVVPPLRRRTDDVLPLAHEFMRRMAERAGLGGAPTLVPDAAARLLAHPWPGNVRELKNVVERAVVLARGGPIGPEHIQLGAPRAVEEEPADPDAPEESAVEARELSAEEAAERRRIIEALVSSKGNQSLAARALGISRSTLLHRLDAYRISRPRKRPPRPV